MFAGLHWTLLGFEAPRTTVVPPRFGLRIHHVGSTAGLRNEAGEFRDAYAMQSGGWVLVRPDGYVGAMVRTE